MANRGQSLELFFIDGTPDGMLTAEIFNWTGHVLVAPRIRLAEALKRAEASFTGIYLLLGDSDDSNLVRVYIGESDDVAARIRNHDANRDWWTQAILITSAANSLNKAHVKYLESRLVEEARRAGRMKLENANTPPKPTLSEAAQANMEQFVDYVLTILPAIRVDGFLVKTRTQAPKSATPSPVESKVSAVFSLRLANGEVNATARLENGEFVVQAGSIGRAKWIGVEHNYQKLFDELVESGVYLEDGVQRRFSKSYAFSSPSAAGAVLNGRATAGPIAWVLANNPKRTYKDWEAEELSANYPAVRV
ncbi:GIY-YIG nuclease family protein [Granulicella sibirica]|uniref:DUF4357 domain-containing protein n=1 Tax=Granulicella sibirica TaxID=2479048 RepID=A0A4Q0SY86_9BACT|nr:GIY-YIG nuclease family protein [Granulicella sibirica]RXH55352.1 hypothetical protein GRAN_4456 [Granulicella sibirica]